MIWFVLWTACLTPDTPAEPALPPVAPPKPALSPPPPPEEPRIVETKESVPPQEATAHCANRLRRCSGPPDMRIYIVREGDMPSTIAKRLYGDPSMWEEIARFNPMVDPTRLTPGDMIGWRPRAPPPPPEPRGPPCGGAVTEVRHPTEEP